MEKNKKRSKNKTIRNRMKSQVIKPSSINQIKEFNLSIFLAGSIEMGVAENWQLKVEEHLSDSGVTIFNPRRDGWDSSWEQKATDEKFKSQVDWELDRLEEADIIFMYLSPQTKSPISLLELGMYVRSGKMVVCCPGQFWRNGNVDILCGRYGAPMFESIDDALKHLVNKI